MSWLGSLLTALVLAVGATLLGGFLASRAARWHRISSFEGKSGYFVVLMGLLAGVFGVVAGLLVARYGGAGDGLPAFATAAAVVIGGLLLVAGLAWLLADRPPRLSGRSLVLDLEIRAPAGGAPLPADSTGFYAYLSAEGAGMSGATLHRDRQAQVAGRWLLPATVAFETRRPRPYIALGGQRLGGATVFFHPELEPPIGDRLGQWGGWLTGAVAGSSGSGDAAGFELRVRPRLAEPPPETP